jgi:hypothetical protein
MEHCKATSQKSKSLSCPVQTGGVPRKGNKEVPEKKYSLKRPQRLPSSKSAVIVDDVLPVADSVASQKQDSIKINKKEKRMMYGTKSGRIFDPKLLPADSTKEATKKGKKKKRE